MTASATSISTWGNYWRNTREARATGPDEILNELTKQKYLIGKLSRDAGALAVAGGSELRDTVKISAYSNARTYRPGETRNPSRGDSDKVIVSPWRLHETDRLVTEAEMQTNKGDQFAKFKNLEKSVKVDLWTDLCNYMETQLWAVPNATNMESLTIQPGQMYSIPVFITESGRRPPSWTTTIQQLDPTTETNWQNAVATYDSANPDSATDGIFAAFDDAMAQIDFEAPQGFEDYMANDDLNGLVICTNRDGYNLYQALCRSANNVTRAGPYDPSIGRPNWNGVPIRYVSALDTSQLDETGAVVGTAEGTYASQAYPAGKPRYFIINTKFAKLWYHPDHLWNEVEKDGGMQARDVMAHFLECWANLFFRSRRRHAIVRPA